MLFLLGEPVYIGGVTATFKACIRFRVAGDLLNIRVTTIRRLVPLLFVFWFGIIKVYIVFQKEFRRCKADAVEDYFTIFQRL